MRCYEKDPLIFGTDIRAEKLIINRQLRLAIPEDLSLQGRRDWPKLRWCLTAQSPQSPKTGDNIRLPAAVFTGALTGLLLALPWGRRFRRVQKP